MTKFWSSWPSFPVNIRFTSDLLDHFTICYSSDLKMAFWWHKEEHSRDLLQELFVILNMNQYCGIILILSSNSCFQMCTINGNWERKIWQALKYPTSLPKIPSYFSWLSFLKKAVEHRSIESFGQFFFCACLAMKATWTRGISYFPLEMFVKTSFS